MAGRLAGTADAARTDQEGAFELELANIQTPASVPTIKRGLELQLREAIEQLTRRNTVLEQEVEALRGERQHEGCGGTLRPSHVTCDLCEGKRVIMPRARARQEAANRRAAFLQYLAGPFFGPQPPRVPHTSHDLQCRFVSEVCTFSMVHTALVQMPRRGLLVRLGKIGRRQTWGLTAAGAEYAGLRDLLVFVDAYSSHYYLPSQETIQMQRLCEQGCHNG